MNDKKTKTIGRSFRIKEDLLTNLNEKAKKDGISPNALLNKILQDYSTYHMYFKRFDAISITQKSFIKFIEVCPKEELKEIARKAGSTNTRDLIYTLGISCNHKSIVFILTKILGEHANWYTLEHHIKKDKEIFHFRHNLGHKWSFYLGEFVSSMFEYFLNKKTNLEYLEDAVNIEIPT